LLERYKCFVEKRCYGIQGKRESRNRKKLQGLQKTKQETAQSAGQNEKITLKSTLKTKTYITVVRNPKFHLMNSVYRGEIFIA
jgi:hypothetical protein